MATQLFFRTTPPDWSRGEGDADLLGTTRSWASQELLLTREAGAGTNLSTTSVADPASGTAGPELNSGGVWYDWVTAPLDRDVTIAGNVVFNLWGVETNMTDNAWIACRVERLDSQGAVQGVVVNSGAIGSELPTGTAAVRTNTVDATDTAFLKGDRIRVRVFFTDIVGTAMGAGGNLFFSFARDTAGLIGDSYLTFTEDFGFLVESPGTDPQQTTDTTQTAFGETAPNSVRLAQSFVAPDSGTLTAVGSKVAIVGAPTDDLVIAIQADASGVPSDTDLTTASVAAASLTTTPTVTSFDISDIGLTAGSVYWIVHRRSGALNNTNRFSCQASTTAYLGGRRLGYNGTSWSAATGLGESLYFTTTITNATTTLYLTDTAAAVDPNGASYDAKEAWTSRGAGVVSKHVDSVTGPTTPLLWRTGTGSTNFLEWFTKPLTAFTLSGLVACNIRARQFSANTNAVPRVELAVCDNDGTNPVVWGTANDYDEIVGSGEGTNVFNVAGDDTAVIDGQRLRIRVYLDDAPGVAMASASSNNLLYYAGTTGGASGDTFITLPQTVTEFSAGTPFIPDLVMARTRV